MSEFTTTAAADAAEQAKRAVSAYRHCSQFTHGKLAVTGSLPDTLSYSAPVLVDWISTATNSANAVIYLLYARYGDELLPTDGDGKLSVTLESSFGHLVEVRRKLGLPADAKVD